MHLLQVLLVTVLLVISEGINSIVSNLPGHLRSSKTTRKAFEKLAYPASRRNLENEENTYKENVGVDLPTPAPSWEQLVEVSHKPAVETETPTEAPTESDAPHSPSEEPTESETKVVHMPTVVPTEAPTESDAPHSPSEEPTEAETKTVHVPTVVPTESPTDAPSESSTEAPTESPTESPTEAPTEAPTESDAPHSPSEEPTESETEVVHVPTVVPTKAPIEAPTEAPTESDAPHSLSEEPTEADAVVVRVPTEAPTFRHKKKTARPTFVNDAGTVPGDPDDKAAVDTNEEEADKVATEEKDQMEMAENVFLLVGVLVILYFVVSGIKRVCSECCRQEDTHASVGENAQYTPVSSIGDSEDHSIEISSFRPIKHSRSHSQRGSTMQAEDEDWDNDLDAAIALSLSEAETHNNTHIEQKMNDYASDGEWDDDFDNVSPRSSTTTPVSQAHEENTFTDNVSTARQQHVEENFLGALMGGQDIVMPHVAKKPATIVGGTGRFTRKDPATPGTTSQAGVKVIKGLSLKDAFGKKK